MSESEQEHLLNHLRDMHAIEVQAVRQLQRAATASDGDRASIYREHLDQTREHEQALEKLVAAHDHEPSAIVDKTLRGGAIGLRQLADIAPDTAVKRAMYLFALEHLEIAGFEFLRQIGQHMSDQEASDAAEQILPQERETAEKVEGLFDEAVEDLLAKRGQGSGDEDDSDKKAELLLGHLRDVHALEQQSLQLLETAVEEICDDEQLEKVYSQHLEQTREQERAITERIEARDAKPSMVRDLHLGAAKTGLRDLTSGPPDAPIKLAMNAYCLEHLEVAAYEFLIRLAKAAGDEETAQAAEQIAQEERKAAEEIEGTFEHCVELTLQSESSYEQPSPGETPSEENASPSAA